jgi:hypothetical protein
MNITWYSPEMRVVERLEKPSAGLSFTASRPTLNVYATT